MIMKKGAASGRAGGMDERRVPWSEEYPESHGWQLNAPRGAAEELGDLLEHRIGNWEIELAYSFRYGESMLRAEVSLPPAVFLS